MCYQHLLGEHSEMHEGVGLIESGWGRENRSQVESQLEGQARAGNIDTSWFVPRHTVLVEEMGTRGGNHNSPLEYTDDLAIGDGAVCEKESMGQLMRCPGCRPRLYAALELCPRDEWDTNARGKVITPTKWYHDRELSDHPFADILDAIATYFGDENTYRDGVTEDDLHAVAATTRGSTQQ